MIKDLNNNEISQVYYILRDYINDVDDALNRRLRMKRIELELPEELGEHSMQPIVLVRISDDEVEGVRSSHHYTTCKSVIQKLHPIVEMIEEVEPEIKSKYDNNE